MGGVLHRRDHRLEQVDGEEPQGHRGGCSRGVHERGGCPRPPAARSSQTATNTTVGVSTRATRPARTIEPLVPGRRSAGAFVKPAARKKSGITWSTHVSGCAQVVTSRMLRTRRLSSIGSRAAMVQCPSTTTTMLAALMRSTSRSRPAGWRRRGCERARSAVGSIHEGSVAAAGRRRPSVRHPLRRAAVGPRCSARRPSRSRTSRPSRGRLRPRCAALPGAGGHHRGSR